MKPESSGSWAKIAVPALSGAIAATTVTLIFRFLDSDKPPDSATEPSAHSVKPAVPPAQPAKPVVDAVPRPPPPKPSAAAAKVEQNAPEPASETGEEVRFKMNNEHASLPRDPKWDPDAEQAFWGDLLAIGKGAGFRVGRVDCRSRSCKVRLEWPSHDKAVDGAGSILHGDFKRNCMRAVFTPDPEPGGSAGRYSHDVFFDCRGDREQIADGT